MCMIYCCNKKNSEKKKKTTNWLPKILVELEEFPNFQQNLQRHCGTPPVLWESLPLSTDFRRHGLPWVWVDGHFLVHWSLGWWFPPGSCRGLLTKKCWADAFSLHVFYRFLMHLFKVSVVCWFFAKRIFLDGYDGYSDLIRSSSLEESFRNDQNDHISHHSPGKLENHRLKSVGR